MGSHIPRTDVRVGMGDYHLLYSHSEFFGDDLGNDRIGSLSHIRGAGDDIDRSEVIDLDNRPATVRFIDPGASAHMDHRCHPNASSISSPPVLPPVQFLRYHIDAFP